MKSPTIKARVRRLWNRIKLRFGIEVVADRCHLCGDKMYGFIVPHEVWMEIFNTHAGVYCYDCFIEASREAYDLRKLGYPPVFCLVPVPYSNIQLYKFKDFAVLTTKVKDHA